ncbi:hypothetical protein PENANT_c065G07545 [Penicillium antarcticum]|uniref:Inner centromere protein ARK-binding domain-containing protein n=1 Tax=Penicillium antarcticum TaxID=416450 RepID=A0A1V6PPV8_9EURO|nr:hypothetical protein PENANT_c065G07545 [Penicillium antarcticum]
MAAAGARAQKPVGSAPWIAAEKENMAELVEQEMEEVEYPVRHEMDWLNEHMTEIFSKGQANFADVFKTPGKMRGKTPRTARKRAPEESRVPLSEIFSAAQKQLENQASPSPFIHRVVSKATATTSTVPRTKDATEQVSQPHYPDLSQNLNSFPKYNTDSGYHGMPDDDEMVLPDVQPESQTSTQPMETDEPMGSDTQEIDMSLAQQNAEDSFHSAQENFRSRAQTVEPPNDPTPTQRRTTRPVEPHLKESSVEIASTPTKNTKPQTISKIADKQEKLSGEKGPEPKQVDEPVSKPSPSPEKTPVADTIQPEESQKLDETTEDTTKEDTVLDNLDDIGSPSDGSTPERPLVRKSSLSFASLPAREPLSKSLGGSRLSRTSHVDPAKMNTAGRPSYFGRQTGGHRMTQTAADNNADSAALDNENDKQLSDGPDPEQATRMHSKKSTQTLHERISMLGKLQPARPRKSIPSASAAATGQVPYPELPASKSEAKPEASSQKSEAAPESQSNDDEWIKPLSSPQRLELSKSKTMDIMEKLSELDKDRTANKKELSAAEPERPKSSYSLFSSPRPVGHQQSASLSHISADMSTTPTGSPKRFDGPISASKLRLQSIMKSAKGLFSSTGNTPRMQSSSPEQHRIKRVAENADGNGRTTSQPTKTISPPRQEGRRTRSSTEKEEKRRQHEQEEREEQQREEQEREEQQREEARLEKSREQERLRALRLKAAQDKSSMEPEEKVAPKASQPQRQQSREPESSQETSSRFGIPQPKQNDRRPLKPTREAVQKPKPPQPMSIRVGSTLSRQIPMASSSVRDSTVSTAAPASAAKPTLKKKGSNNSLHTASSTSSFKSTGSSQTQAQRKAQLASERRKEQEDRRKEEQQREMDRKRAQQQQEEARRQNMRSRAETERERREPSAQEDPEKAARMQAIRNRQMENARKHERHGSQQMKEAPILQHEKASSQSSQRSDLGATRPPSRLGSMQPYSSRINPPAPNPAKPLKRGMDEEANHRPAVSKPANVHPTGESKRRKTEDEHNPIQAVRAPMPPPVRTSSIRKPSIFGHSQSSMSHQSSSTFNNAQPQRPAHPMGLAKYTSGKIPFAEPNHAPPPAPKAAPGSAQRAPAKPSPKYPSGESIHLPEIATDSEDEDDSDSEMFPVPDWAQPKHLEGLLRQQDGMEVDSIFGPIAPFSMEDNFKGDKKIKKYRERTSSANWSGPDGLTQEEIRKDLAERQRLKLNGGWRFNSST